MTTLVKEGWLFKRSKFIKQWRERWVVMTDEIIKTFANYMMDTPSTAEIYI
jgi:hypothetical protein